MRPAGTLQPLAVTMGDPAGIGLDITLKAYARARDLALPPFVLYGCIMALAARARGLGLDGLPLKSVASAREGAQCFRDALPVISLATAMPVTAGRPDAANASSVIAAIDAAVAATIAGETAAVVTNPIAKATLYASGFKHPGHTEYLGALAAAHFPGGAGAPVMMLAADELKVVPLTIHIPLSTVPAAITQPLILATARTLASALSADFGIANPRIAVAGLNPHAGEGGTIGGEETATIAPAIATLRGQGLAVSGPHSADTLFHAAARTGYDAVIAMYHDQALIPIKTLAFDRGVNVTLGLPFVRTSPDHGTAFDIAGTGRASEASLVAALRMAAAMTARRHAGVRA